MNQLKLKAIAIEKEPLVDVDGNSIVCLKMSATSDAGGRRLATMCRCSWEFYEYMKRDYEVLERHISTTSNRMSRALTIKAQDWGTEADLKSIYEQMVKHFTEGITQFFKDETPWVHHFGTESQESQNP